jgi:protein involved in polysaccharide export with SLBB domain
MVIVSIALLSLSPPSQAQQTGDINQQLQLFNSLSPEQQQALLQRLNGEQAGLSGTTGQVGQLGTSGVGQALIPNANSAQSVLLQQMQLQQQRRLQSKLGERNGPYGLNGPNGLSGLNGLNGLPEAPVFKPGDTVLVELTLLPEASNPSPTPSFQPSLPAYAQQPLAQQPMSPSSGTLNAQQEQPQRTIEELKVEEKMHIEEMIGHIRLNNPYVVDQNGELHLPGVPPMMIAGLTEDLATRRVAANLAFEKVQITLTRLPIDKSGRQALKPFGYDLFDNSIVGLLPMLNLPVPADYVVGPGDVVQVQLFGTVNSMLHLTVARNGEVNFPQIGPIQVAGQRYSAMQSDIEERVNRQMIGTHASVAMGEVRTINVFVIGSATYPGSYTVSSLATVTTALFAAGGVLPKGSLRTIQVKRQGETLRTFDLYDLLMRGDSSNDIRLQPGDVVFIPPIGRTASVDGEVQRPAVYELKGDQSVADLIRMGAGLTPDADVSSAALVRVDAQLHRVVLEVNPTAASTANVPLRNGDLLEISRLRPELDSGITIKGHVYREKHVAWHDGIRLSEVISSIDDLMPGADQDYLLIRRELPPNRRVAVLSADLAAALHAPASSADVRLMPRDRITVFDKDAGREWVIQPILNELRLQSGLKDPTEIVHIEGQVKVPGDYPLEPGMRVSDLLRAGGGLSANAYAARAELARYSVENGDQRNTQVITVDLGALSNGDHSADVTLQPFDRLSVQEISGWTEQDQIRLRGEVRFPGTYAIRPGETLSSVVKRAGGLTQFAFADGSVFTRVELKRAEQQELDRLAVRMRTEIAEVALMGVRAQQGSAPSAISVGETLLRQLTEARAVGRLVIDLPAVMTAKPGSNDDVILRNGDELIVPKQRQEVMVLGEVQDPTSHLYKRDMSRDDYITQSGGPTSQANKSHIYVVHANGSVESGSRGWFHSGDGVQIRPGDAIVVPLDTERLPALTVWTATSTILYNIAIAASAAKNTF